MDNCILPDTVPSHDYVFAMPLPVAAWLGGMLGSAALSGISNLIGQHHANKANLQSVRETNQLNYQIHQEDLAAQRANQEYQNRFNLGMLNQSNVYNSPGSQKARLLAAGINPASMLGSPVAESSSLESAGFSMPAAPNMQAASVQPYNFDFIHSGFANMLSSLSLRDSMLSNSVQRESDLIDLSEKRATSAARISSMMSNYNKSSLEYQILSQELHRLSRENKLGDESFDDIKESVKLGNKTLSKNIEKSDFDMALSSARLELDKTIAASSVKLNDAQTAVAYQTLPQLIASTSKIIADTSSVVNDTSERKATFRLRAQRQAIDNIGSELRNTYQRLVNVGVSRENSIKLIQKSLLDNEIYHESNKSSSIINSALEQMFGVGFRDVGSSFNSIFKK